MEGTSISRAMPRGPTTRRSCGESRRTRPRRSCSTCRSWQGARAVFPAWLGGQPRRREDRLRRRFHGARVNEIFVRDIATGEVVSTGIKDAGRRHGWYRRHPADLCDRRRDRALRQDQAPCAGQRMPRPIRLLMTSGHDAFAECRGVARRTVCHHHGLSFAAYRDPHTVADRSGGGDPDTGAAYTQRRGDSRSL